VESGELETARREIDAYARLVEPLGIPAYSWWVPAWEAMLAGIEGRFDDVRRLSGVATEIGSRGGDTNAAVFQQLSDWWADMQQGRDTDRWLDLLGAGMARGGPSDAFRCGLAMQLALTGRVADARRALADLGPDGLDAVVKDMNFYAAAAEFTFAVGILGDGELAARAYEILRLYSGRILVIARAAVCLGPAECYLGRLAAAAAMWDEAERHFERGLSTCERLGARAVAARTRWWYAEMLRRRSVGSDEHADELEAAAIAEAEALGLALERR
jgi:hypothetical protein